MNWSLDGCARVAQIYNYSYDNIEMAINFQTNLISLENKSNCDMDGRARWRKNIITIKIQSNRLNIFKGI